jgi:nucleoside-triphosphatase
VSGVAAPKLLLTGEPGSGKTTTLRAVVDRLRGRVPLTGFLTEEIREGARRVGFRGVTLDGKDFLLAHVRNTGSSQVGPYGVELSGLDTIGVAAMKPAAPGTLVVVDEIGKMECLSAAFKAEVERLLDDDTPLLASIAAVGTGFVKKVRKHPRVKTFTLARGGSAAMAAELERALERALGRGAGVTR